MKPVLLYSIFPNIESARAIAKDLVSQKLVACVNIFQNIESLYIWEGELENSSEIVLMAKLFDEHYLTVQSFIVKNHPYSCACVLKINIESMNPPYLNWLKSTLP